MAEPQATSPAQAASPAARSPATAASKTSSSPKSPRSPRAADSPEADVHDPIEAADALPEGDGDSSYGDYGSSFTSTISSSILQYRTVNGRTYHSDRIGENYWGSNDEKQGGLLDIAHQVFTLMLGHRLYTSPLEDDKIQRALDLGTGTGIWVIDFADEHPNCEVIGTDISPIQPTWVPPNVKFEIDDFTKPWTFPDNYFDFIHVRWVLGVVPNWEWFVKEAYRCLKPGGWFETCDFNAYFDCDDDTLKGTAADQWGDIVFGGAEKLGIKASFAVVRDNLQRTAVDAAGLVNVEEKLFKMPFSEWPKDPKLREIGLYYRAMLEADTEGMVTLLATSNGWTKDEVTVYAAKLRQEMRGMKVHAYFWGKTVHGQKPLA